MKNRLNDDIAFWHWARARQAKSGVSWSTYWTTQLKNKCIGYWRMNEASGNAVDSLGLHTGAATSVSAYSADYGIADGYQFVQDSTRRRVYCGAISQTKYTISLWEKTGTLSTTKAAIVGVGGNYTGLFVEQGGHITILDSAGNDLAAWSVALATDATYAHHLILEIDATAGTAELYYDMVSIGKKTIAAPALANFVIANAYAGGAFYSSRSFPGILGNVGLFNDFLTIEEKAILFNEYKENYYPFTNYNPTRRGNIVFSFDDGYASGYNIVHPLFQSRNKKATYFILLDAVGSTYNGIACMSWANLAALEAAGHELGSHGKTHISFTALSELQLRAELDAVDSAFTTNGLTLPETAAYPSGQYNDAVKVIVADYYKMVRAVGGTQRFFPYDQPVIDKYIVSSINAGDATYDNIAVLKALVDNAAYRGSTIVLFLHDIVASNPSNGARSTAYLTELLDYCINKQMNIMTFNELYDILA